jgi:integrase
MQRPAGTCHKPHIEGAAMTRAKITKRPYTYKGKTEDRWLVLWRDLKGIRREKRFPNKRHAEAFATKIDRELADKIHVADRVTITFKEAAEKYLKWNDQRHESRNRDLAGATRYNYNNLIRKHVIPALGHLKLNKIRTPDVQRLLVDKKAEIYKHSTVDTLYSFVVYILNYAVDNEWLPRNPLKDRPCKIPGKATKRDDVPEYEEVRQLFAFLLGPKARTLDHGSWMYMRVAVSLAAFAGMRGGEICALKWPNIDWVNDEIRVEESRSEWDGDKDPKTEAGRRSIPMNPILRQALIDLHEFWRRPTEGYVLRGRKGPIGPVYLQKSYRRIMRGAGLCHPGGKKTAENPDGELSNFSLHALRHFAVSTWLGKDMRIQDAQRHLGHKSITTTINTYGHFLKGDDHSRRAMAKTVLMFPDMPAAQIQNPTIEEPAIPTIEGLAAPQIDSTAIAQRVVEPPRFVSAEELMQVGDTVTDEQGHVHSLRAPDNAPPWVAECLDLLRGGWQLIDVCKHLRRSRQVVAWNFKRYGLAGPRIIMQSVRNTRFQALMDAGYGDYEIAEKVGCSVNAVWSWRVMREGRGEEIRGKRLNDNKNYLSHVRLKTGKTRENQLKLL